MGWTVFLWIPIGLLSSGIVLYALWIGAVSILGMGRPEKNYPPAAPNRIAVIICARNEESVITQLIDSLQKQNYPKEYYQIFVVAHNCRDHTAERAVAHGATVFVRNCPEETRKAQALQYGLDCVRRDYGNAFSHYAVFDADCLVHHDFLKEINAALATGADAAAGYYGSKNFEDSLVSRLAGTLYSAIIRGTCIPQDKLGLPVNVYGSGYAAKMEYSTGLDTLTTLVDDFEFSTGLVMRGARLVAAPKAVIYAEMPVTLREALVQRRRWAIGDSQCFRKYAGELRRALPRLGWSGIKQYMDLLMNPTAVCTFFALLLGGVLLWHAGQLRTGLLCFLAAALVYCAVFWCYAVDTLRKDGRPLGENLLVCLLFPAWVLVTPVFAIEALFVRDIKWTETRRSSRKRIEDMEAAKEK